MTRYELETTTRACGAGGFVFLRELRAFVVKGRTISNRESEWS